MSDSEDEIAPEVVVEAPAAEPEAAPEPDEGDSSPVPPSDQPLSPRHRRLCEYLAHGDPVGEIAKALHYTPGRIYTLKTHPRIKAEVARISDRIHEETIKSRLKSVGNAAMDHVEFVLKDRTNKVKINEKSDMAKWVVEKLDGKAAQVHDVGENLLGVMMDRLDGLKNAGRSLGPQTSAPLEIEAREVSEPAEPARPKTDEELLAEWVTANPLD
jgi:DNA-binding CsgD family transcriptional regulator